MSTSLSSLRTRPFHPRRIVQRKLALCKEYYLVRQSVNPIETHEDEKQVLERKEKEKERTPVGAIANCKRTAVPSPRRAVPKSKREFKGKRTEGEVKLKVTSKKIELQERCDMRSKQDVATNADR